MSLTGIVQEAWTEQLQTRFQAPPEAGEKRENTWASAVRECERQMALDLIHPEDRGEFDHEAMERMERGRERDRDISTRLIQVGMHAEKRFDVEMRQTRFTVRDRNEAGGQGPVIVSGRVDGVIVFDDPVEERGRRIKRVPFEIKSGMSAMNVGREEDLDKGVWTRHFVDQLLMYVYAMNDREEVPLGFLVLEQAGLPLILDIWLEDHLDRVENNLRKARQAWNVRHRGAQLPEEIGDPEACWRCDHYRKSCAPATDYGPGVGVVDDPEVIRLLDERGATHEASKTFGRNHEKLKKVFKGVDVGRPIIAGDWEVRLQERKDGVKVMNIGRIGGRAGEGEIGA